MGSLQLHYFFSDALTCARHITIKPRLTCDLSFVYLQRMIFLYTRQRVYV